MNSLGALTKVGYARWARLSPTVSTAAIRRDGMQAWINPDAI